jgi:hypothetical protein
MIVHLAERELDDFDLTDDAGSTTHNVDVPGETVERWGRIIQEYDAMQAEMRQYIDDAVRAK